MKNATKHADVIKSLIKKLPKELRQADKPKVDPLTTLIRACLVFDASEELADAALKRFTVEFIDHNELRVATELEVQELLGPKYPKAEDRTAVLRSILNAIYDYEQILTLDRLRELRKNEIRAFLRELPLMNPFIEGYVMLVAFDAASMPVDETMTNWLIEKGALEPDTTVEQAQAFLEKETKADDTYPLFRYLQRESFGFVAPDKPKAKKK